MPILLSFFIPPNAPIQVRDGTLPGALLGIAPHLLLFLVIAALPAPRWAKAAGYIPFLFLLPSVVLLPLWLVLVGRQLTQLKEHAADSVVARGSSEH